MPGIWERLRRLWTRGRARAQGRGPLQALEEYREKLVQSVDKLSWQYLKLGEVRGQLAQRAERLKRLIQRYDEQARRHYKLGHLELAKAALREKLAHEAELARLQDTLHELDRQRESLRAYKERLTGQLQLYELRKEALEIRYSATRAELEARELQATLSLDELPELQEAVAQAESEIREIQARLEAVRELQAEAAPPWGDVGEEALAEAIERLKAELQPAPREREWERERKRKQGPRRT